MRLKMRTLTWQRIAIKDTESSVIAISGGLGSSKTHGAVLKHFSLNLLNKDSPYSAFIEPSYRLVKSVAMPTWRKALEGMGFKNRIDFRMQMGSPFPILHFYPLNQEIHFLTGSDPSAIVGAEYSHATIDEADEQPVETFKNVRDRTRREDARCRQVVLAGAPQGIRWFAERFDSETLPDWHLDSPLNWSTERQIEVSGKLKTVKMRRLRLITDDNPFLPEDYIPNLMDNYGHSQNLVKAYRYGIFVPLFEGTAYKAFREEEHVLKERVEADPGKPIYLTFDFNAEPMCWIAVQIRQHPDIPGRLLYTVIDEASEGLSGLDDALYDFATKFNPKLFRSTEIRVYGDRSGYQSHHRHKLDDFKYIQQELRGFYSYVYIEASKKVAPETGSVEAVNRCFTHARIRVNPGLKGIIRSWQATRWKDGIRKLDKPAGETWTHRSDAFKYLIYQLEVIDALQNEHKTYGVNI